MISNARRKKIFVTFVFFAAILMLMGALTAAESEEPLSKDTIEMIEMSLKDIKESRVYTTDEVRKRLKIA